MISYYLPSESKIGVGHQVHALANAMVDRGHEVTVFSACAASVGARYRTETVRPTGSNRTFKFALLMRKVDFSHFDVLHAHGDDYWLWRRRVPVHIRTLHGSCFDEARWIRGARERIRMLMLGLGEVLASVVADTAVGVSNHSIRFIPWSHDVIPNGVDLRRFGPRPKSGTPTILFVGTYERRKRGSLVVSAFENEVKTAIPEAKLQMVCDDAPTLPGVQVLGRVSDQRLAELYGEAWVFCLPSIYEGFGIPYIEAMASGCPVVATPNPGANEVTSNGTFGRLSDDRRLGKTLVELLTSERERDRLTKVGLQRAQDFDLARVVTSYEDLYQCVRQRVQATLAYEARR